MAQMRSGLASLRAVPAAAARRARAFLLDGFAWLFTVPMLRLATGAWPARDDVAAFRHAFRRFTPLPPLMRALASVPAGREQLTRAMLAGWLMADETYHGRLRAELTADDARTGNGLVVWSGPKLTFLHLEKTAGMSVVAALSAQFHPLQIDAHLRRAFPPHVLNPIIHFRHDEVKRAALVWGHYDMPSIAHLGGDRFIFTFLRDPAARIVSLYRYWRGQAALDLGWRGMNQPVLLAQQLDLADFLESDDQMLVNYLDNFYVRRLIGQYIWPGERDYVADNPEAALQAALTALASIDFVGITEDTDGSLVRLGKRLGFAAPPRSPRVNVTRAAGDIGNIDARAAASLQRLTRLDRVVYEAGQEWYRKEGLLF
jgi:hypothetical protein